MANFARLIPISFFMAAGTIFLPRHIVVGCDDLPKGCKNYDIIVPSLGVIEGLSCVIRLLDR